jgi:uncharacterized membrane protein YeaQ/YmgE (transglycosylase-associated protein family)
MTISVLGLIIYVIIAAICGAIGKAIAGDVRGGFIVSMVGPWIALQLKLSEPFMISVDGHPFGLLWSIIGAAVFVAIIHLFSHRW